MNDENEIRAQMAATLAAHDQAVNKRSRRGYGGGPLPGELTSDQITSMQKALAILDGVEFAEGSTPEEQEHAVALAAFGWGDQ